LKAIDIDMSCRHCSSEENFEFINLGSSPASNSYLSKEELEMPESWFPLQVFVCLGCFLVQTKILKEDLGLFQNDYAYFSSYSKTMLKHSKEFVNYITNRLSLNDSSRVVEIASNDGYLLQFFKEINIPCIGIEPTSSTAKIAKSKGIKVIEEFFGESLANRMCDEDLSADLIISNNVLAHVPDINDFVSGINTLLKKDGVATFEFPYLHNLVKYHQFDTIYHEHFFYFSLNSVSRVCETNGLFIYDLEEIDVHGGSLRIFAEKINKEKNHHSDRYLNIMDRERDLGMNEALYYTGFKLKVDKIKDELKDFLILSKEKGKVVIGYGAAAKGNTLLNYAGIQSDLIRFVVDKNPAKQNKFLPGSKISILSEEAIKRTKPDYILILPWNIKEEIMKNLAYTKEWGCKFVTSIPRLRIYE